MLVWTTSSGFSAQRARTILGGTTRLALEHPWGVEISSGATPIFQRGESSKVIGSTPSGSRTEVGRRQEVRMVRLNGLRRVVWAVCVTVATLGITARPASAQDADPNTGALTVTGGIDFTNAYLFRGIPQDETKVIVWPYADLGIAVLLRRRVKSVGQLALE